MTTLNSLQARLAAALGSEYHIERELAPGGMARVFLAEDVRLKRQVVIKVPAVELNSRREVERFEREILLSAQLQHPNIVPILFAGDAEGTPYYAMPYISGLSLAERLAANGRLDIADATHLLRDLARALAFAHRQGVIHRDIKPSNILLVEDAAVVTDFGIAKALSHARTGESQQLTQTGSSIGTPTYMAPEQAAADPIADHRVDIYAWGVVAFEVLTGRTPFHGRTPQALLRAHLVETPPRVTDIRPEVPVVLSALIARCLSKDQDDRPATAEDIMAALDNVDTKESLAVDRQQFVKAKRGIMIAAGIVALLVAAIGSYAITHRKPKSVLSPELLAVLPFRVASSDPALAYLREGMMDLLSLNLPGEGGIRATEPRTVLGAWRTHGGDTKELSEQDELALARDVGAGKLLLGEVVGTPTSLSLTVSVLAVPAGDRIARASVTGSPDSLASLVDQLSATLLSQLAPTNGQRTAPPTTRSLAALRAYFEGRAMLRRGNPQSAAEAFGRALKADTTFATAALSLYEAASWYGDPPLLAEGLRVANRERARLNAREQAYLFALGGPNYPAPANQTEIYKARQAYVALAPDRADAWELLGDELFHYGNTLDEPRYLEKAFDALRRAAALDSLNFTVYAHIGGIAARLGDTTYLKRVRTWRPQPDTSMHFRQLDAWQMVIARRDARAQAALRDSFSTFQDGTLFDVMKQSVFGGQGADARAAAIALEQHATPTSPERFRAQRLMDEYRVFLVTGQPNRALGALASLDTGDLSRFVLPARANVVGEIDDKSVTPLMTQLATLELPRVPADTLGCDRQRAIIRALEPWRIAHGDTTHAASAIARLTQAQSCHKDSTVAAKIEVSLIETMLAGQRGKLDDFRTRVNRLDAQLRELDYRVAEPSRAAFANLLVARMFERLGDVKAARAAVVRRSEGMNNADEFIGTQLREEGRLSALLGDEARARDAYDRYLRLNDDPEPPVRVEVDRVRAAAARLRADRPKS